MLYVREAPGTSSPRVRGIFNPTGSPDLVEAAKLHTSRFIMGSVLTTLHGEQTTLCCPV